MKLTHPKPPPQINEIIQRTGASRVPVSQFLNAHRSSAYSASILCHTYKLQQERNITAFDIIRELTVEGLQDSMKKAFMQAFNCDRHTALNMLEFLGESIEAKVKFRHLIIESDGKGNVELHFVVGSSFCRLYEGMDYLTLEIQGVSFERGYKVSLISILTAHLGIKKQGI